MELKDYSEFVKTTAVYPNIGQNWQYTLIGLTGELGELANILKKVMRDYNGIPTSDHYNKIIDELGDVFWYLTMLCYEFRIDPKLVLEGNVSKLVERKKTNTLHDIGRKEK